MAADIIFHFILLFCCIGILCVSVAKRIGILRERKHRRIRPVVLGIPMSCAPKLQELQ
jgi:hypothetical protein